MTAESSAKLRTAEKLILAFLAYAVVGSLVFSLSWRERFVILGLNLVAGAVVVALSKLGAAGRSRFFEPVRDWLPCFLILVAYRESGLFYRADPTHHLDYVFIRWDDALLRHPWTVAALGATAPWLQYYLELAYFFCYPIVPLGLGALYIARQYGKAIDLYWSALLLAAFVCYVLYPHFPLTPPRELFHDLPGPAVAPLLRKTNFWVLGNYSVGACLFPSAHVASILAAALVIRRYLPRVGVAFLIVAASISVATVYGRYHYAADALAGALVGLAVYFVSRRICGLDEA